MATSSVLRSDVLDLVVAQLREALERSDASDRGEAGESTKLMGSHAPLDSVGLVALIVGLEREIHSRWGRLLELADGRAMARRPSPFRTAGTLADYITERLGDGVG